MPRRTPLPSSRVATRLRVHLWRTMKGLAEPFAFVATSTAILDALAGRWPSTRGGPIRWGKATWRPSL
jgi:hypothetical protein